jgi:hypothetical protein
VVHAEAEVAQRVARQAVARVERLERARLRGGDDPVVAPRLHQRQPLERARVAVVDEVVERAEDEVEQVDVVAHVARQQAAGDRERAGDPPRRRARPAQLVVVRPLQQHASSLPRPRRRAPP